MHWTHTCEWRKVFPMASTGGREEGDRAGWSFANDPEFQPELDWIDTFVREEVQPLDHVLGSQWNIHDPEFERLVRPLQAQVKARGLWACHLGPELGGPGYGQLKLALMRSEEHTSELQSLMRTSDAVFCL